jgi:Skp family chaperone for outer membrane proteins
MFCTNCGKEVAGDAFCSNCGTPMNADDKATPSPVPTTVPSSPAGVPAGPPPLISPPASAAQPGPPGAKKKKRWLVPTIATVCILAIAAVVLVLVFVVFAGSSPSATVESLFKALESKNAQSLNALIDMQPFKSKPGLEASFKADMAKSLKDTNVKFKDAKFSTAISGDTATVKVTGGTVQYKGADGKLQTGPINEDFSKEFYLVKKDGKWLLSEKNFASEFAKQDLKSADKALQPLIDGYNKLNSDVTSAFSDVTGVTGFQELDTKFKEKSKTVTAEIDAFLGKAAQLKADYEAVAKAEGAEEYKAYTDVRINEVNDLIAIGNKLKAFLGEVGAVISGWVTAPPTSQAAVTQTFNDITNKYEAELNTLEADYKKLDAEADASMKDIGLE